MIRWKGVIAPAAGRDVHEKALFCADVELRVEGQKSASRRVRGDCVLIDEDEERRAIDISNADLAGWSAQVERASWGELEERLGDLFGDDAPRKAKTEVSLAVKQPGRHTVVFVDGDERPGPDGEVLLVARKISLPAKAAAPRPGKVGAASATRAVAGAAKRKAAPHDDDDDHESAGATLTPPAGTTDRGGALVPALWALVGAGLGFVALRLALYARTPFPHPALAPATWAVAAAALVGALLALTRALGIPNEGSTYPGPSALPEFVFGARRRSTGAIDLMAVLGFSLWSALAGYTTINDVAKITRTEDLELRAGVRGAGAGARLVDRVRLFGGASLVLAGAIGATLWLSRRRNARTAARLLEAEPGTRLPRVGEWNAFVGVVSSAAAAHAARWNGAIPGRGPADRDAPEPLEGEGTTEPFSLAVQARDCASGRALTVEVPEGATWASSFRDVVTIDVNGSPTRVPSAWLPDGAVAVVAGRLDHFDGDRVLLAAGGEDELIVFASSEAQAPRSLLQSRLWLHHLIGLVTLVAMAGGTVLALRR